MHVKITAIFFLRFWKLLHRLMEWNYLTMKERSIEFLSNKSTATKVMNRLVTTIGKHFNRHIELQVQVHGTLVQ